MKLVLNSLNVDCLKLIFDLLELKDKINAAEVNNVWFELMQQYWTKKTIIKSTKRDFDLENESSNKLDIGLFRTVILNYINYLIALDLFHESQKHLNFENYANGGDGFFASSGTQILNTNCCNIQNLKICNCIVNYNDQDLIIFFKKNPLKKITLRFQDLAECLVNIKFEILENLNIFECEVPINIICSIFRKIKNPSNFLLHETIVEDYVKYPFMIQELIDITYNLHIQLDWTDGLKINASEIEAKKASALDIDNYLYVGGFENDK